MKINLDNTQTGLDLDGFNRKKWIHDFCYLPKSEKPELVVLAGGSGVGKGILTKVLKKLEVFQDHAAVIDPELVIEYAKKLGEGKFLTRHPEEEPENAPLFYKLRNRMVMDCLSHGISVIVDDHCSRIDKMQELMEMVQAHNDMARDQPNHFRPIESALVGMFMPKERYLHRLTRTHNGVGLKEGTPDHEFALHINQAFAQNFPELVKLFDTSILLQNEEREINAAAEYVTAAKYIVDYGKLMELKKDEQRFDEFQRYARETLPAPTHAWSGRQPEAPEPRDRKSFKGTGLHSFAERLDPTGKNWKNKVEESLDQSRAQKTEL